MSYFYDDFYDDVMHVAEDDSRGFGPVFAAMYTTDSACCGNAIEPGDDARADGRGGWIHANRECEQDAAEGGIRAAEEHACPSCFCVHAGECL